MTPERPEGPAPESMLLETLAPRLAHMTEDELAAHLAATQTILAHARGAWKDLPCRS